ncbi:MAG: WbqC family protein, partial [Tannerellaceae bacterium]|nr:WbqC family protein [Tannerellaceae bacterium]
MRNVSLATAYLAPIQYYCKLFHFTGVCMETAENYPKQTYRNRCLIAGANGLLTLSVPIEKPNTQKCLTRDIRISNHGDWRRLHWNAITSSYNTSPFFAYYADDFRPFYEKKYRFLLDFNEHLRERICELLDMHPLVSYTESYIAHRACDFREIIRPRRPDEDVAFRPIPYYQVFGDKSGFLPNLSIIDLLFNMGPESLLI